MWPISAGKLQRGCSVRAAEHVKVHLVVTLRNKLCRHDAILTHVERDDALLVDRIGAFEFLPVFPCREDPDELAFFPDLQFELGIGSP